MQDQEKGIYVLDLSGCNPPEALSHSSRPGAWTMVDYEIEQGHGVMLFGSSLTDPPPVTLKSNVSGWHGIYLGIYYGAKAGFLTDRILKVKLTGDAAYSRIGREDYRREKDGHYPEKELKWSDIAEVFWKCADLTGEALHFACPTHGLSGDEEANIAYVKFVPLTKTEVGEIKENSQQTKTRRLIANYDGGNIGQWGLSSPDEMKEEFESLRGSDFDIALYGIAYGPICFYPTRVGEFIRSDIFVPSHNRYIAQAVHRLWGGGIDLLRVAIEMAHEVNVKLFPQVRFEATQLPPQHETRYFGGEMMTSHPEWLARYPDGEPTRHLSFAFPEVRQFYLKLFREWVEDYQADGVNALFSRSDPFVYYEEPVLNAFREKYGEDMRKLPQTDERVLHCRAGFLTQFLREVRQMLDEIGLKQERYIPACYLVPVNNTPGYSGTAVGESLLHALDVASWIKEGMVDYLSVHIHYFGEHDGSEQAASIREFVDLAQGTKTKIYADVYPRRMPPRAYRKIAMSYYEAGADGLAFWDSHSRNLRASEWAFVRKLGHQENLAEWEGRGDDYYRTVAILSLDGHKMGREFSLPTDG